MESASEKVKRSKPSFSLDTTRYIVHKELHSANIDQRNGDQLRNIADSMAYAYKRPSALRKFGEQPLPMSPLVESWYRDLLEKFPSKSARPEVVKGAFQDATKLFGTNMGTKLTLRHSRQLGLWERIVLFEFDPNFTSDKVECRHPTCAKTNTRAVARGMGKRDLYLCAEHRTHLTNYIADSCAKKNIHIPTAGANQEEATGHFDGYTSLIGLLEKAYYDAKTFKTGMPSIAQEAILNVRNFLIITSTLLNPNEANLEVGLPPVYHILLLILQNAVNSAVLLSALSLLLREVIETILFAFGVVYTWVSLALANPGAQIGAGVGGVLGLTASVLGPWAGAAGFSAGIAIGGLIGNGIYNLQQERRQGDINRFREYWIAAGNRQGGNVGALAQQNQHPGYLLEGDAFGGLDLHAFPANP